ncbi:MAG: hypothetical protein GTN69_03030, partial [Armatimonadetes bacterium]|nr:hypothetical protein [Armatimonadota bacterium]NIO74871.1 hypothetical protein [Armatimonadota bacterium]NIO95632.1 hypothetical protein [Armatimonadota bacterium]
KDEGKKLSPALALPLEKEDPHGWDKAEICFAPLGPYYYAHWYLSKTDSAGSRWTYKFEKFVQPDESLSLAPKIEVPNLDDPVLEVTLKAESDQDHAARKPTNLTLGVAVVLKSGDENRFYKEILKDGTVVSVHARLVDGEGSLVESIEKPLSELGFT